MRVVVVIAAALTERVPGRRIASSHTPSLPSVASRPTVGAWEPTTGAMVSPITMTLVVLATFTLGVAPTTAVPEIACAQDVSSAQRLVARSSATVTGITRFTTVMTFIAAVLE